jgi:heat shock protein HslJ
MKGFFLTIAIITAILISCGSTPPQTFDMTVPVLLIENETIGREMTENELAGKEWKLTQVRINGVSTGFDRSELTRSGYTDAFTLIFEADMLGGLGAPNRYSAPYTLKEGRQITIALIRATLMAAFREPDKLREHNYFGYLQNTTSWNFVNNNLELYSEDEDGKAVVLIFSL